MELISGKQAAKRVAGIINAKYQVHGYSVHLTVKKIYAVDPLGQLDYGGNEYVAAGRIPIITHQRRPEDRWEWWDLGRGSYFVEFNETLELKDDEIGLLEPDERLLRAGAMHSPIFLRGVVAPLETLLVVDAVRLQVKQNARISRMRIFRLTTPAARSPRAPRRALRRRRPVKKSRR